MCGKPLAFHERLLSLFNRRCIQSSAEVLSDLKLAAVAYDRYDCCVMIDHKDCPRCGTGRLKPWSELTDEQREVVRRLPASADYSLDERQARHRWCTRCWYEDTGAEAIIA